MSPVNIDFSNAKESHFEPLPRGVYGATVFEATMTETGEGGKLPAGTPRISVQFKITEPEEYANRRVFTGYIIPPADYPKAETMTNMLFTFLRAIGYSDAELKKLKKLPDPDEFAGRECKVRLGTQEYPPNSGEINNTVRDVLPKDAAVGVGGGASSSGLSGL